VRVALGATPQSMLKMVLASVTGWVVAGVGTGWIASGFASRLLQSLLFPVSARDPRPRVRAVAILLLVAFFSAWIPARRALRVDPWVALRHE
jgi:putative ABC transport system permease protein